MQDDDNAPAQAEDEPQVIPNEEPLAPPEEHEAKAKPESQDDDEPDKEEPEGDGEEPAEDDDPQPKRKRPGKYQRTVSRLEGKIAQLESLLMQRGSQQQQAQPRQEAAEAPPKQADFTDYAEYLEARAEWKGREAARQLIQGERKQFQDSARQRSEQAAWQQYEGRLEEARDKYDDFDEVAFDQSVPITDDMTRAIMTAKNGPDIQYYLGTNPGEAKKIARMDPYSQVRAIGRLEAKLSTPSPKKTTQAPKPVKPLGGTAAGGVGSNDPSKMSMEDFVKWRQAGNG